MPTREERQSSLAKCVIIKRVPPWGSISADSRAGRTLLTIRINGIKRVQITQYPTIVRNTKRVVYNYMNY